MQGACATSLLSPAPDMPLMVCGGAECWNVGFKGQTQREDQGWLHGDSLKGLKCGTGCSQGVYVYSQPTREVKGYC